MSGWKKHLLTGLILNTFFVVSLLIYSYFNNFSLFLVDNLFIFSFIFILFPLLPDLDHSLSKIVFIFVSSSLGYSLFNIFKNIRAEVNKGVYLTCFFFFTPHLFKHRGFIHSISFCVLIGFIVYLLTNILWLSVFASFSAWTHLFEDKIWAKLV